ncbi:MAG: sigma-70 family RNA polymerase sigma factor [Pseudomonadota bacterium]
MSSRTWNLTLELIADRGRLRRSVGSFRDSDDAIQTVSERLLNADREPDAAYLTAAVRNAAVDRYRAETTRKKYEEQFAAFSDTTDRLTPEVRAEGAEALTALQQAIDELEPVNREIFVRALVYDEPRASIAHSLGLKLPTIEKRLAKSRRYCFDRVRPHIDDD